MIRNIQEVTSYRALHTEVFPIMRYIGPYTSCDPVLLVKIIRLGKCFMTKVQLCASLNTIHVYIAILGTVLYTLRIFLC